MHAGRLRQAAGAAAALAIGLAAGCSREAPAPGSVAPATGAELAAYADAITDASSRAKDASLYEYFCRNALGGPCPADIYARLAPHRADGESRVSTADAFVRMWASEHKQAGADYVTDQEYLSAAYQVVLGRVPDADGAAANLAFIERTGEREQMLRSMLQSQEFRSK